MQFFYSLVALLSNFSATLDFLSSALMRNTQFSNILAGIVYIENVKLTYTL